MTVAETLQARISVLLTRGVSYRDAVALADTPQLDPTTGLILDVYLPGGAVGPVGPAGPDGATGPPGPDGNDGPAGPVGATGSTGTPGTNATGAPGAQGIPGAPGTNGTNGADGAPGAPGATGATGPAGADGATGATGPAGADAPTTLFIESALPTPDVTQRGFTCVLTTVGGVDTAYICLLGTDGVTYSWVQFAVGV